MDHGCRAVMVRCVKGSFQQHLPLLWEGEFLVATDSSACNPQDADCRQAGSAVFDIP